MTEQSRSGLFTKLMSSSTISVVFELVRKEEKKVKEEEGSSTFWPEMLVINLYCELMLIVLICLLGQQLHYE